MQSGRQRHRPHVYQLLFQALTLGSNAQGLLSGGTHGQFFESKLGNGLGVIMGVCIAGKKGPLKRAFSTLDISYVIGSFS